MLFFGQKCEEESVGEVGGQGPTLLHIQLRYFFSVAKDSYSFYITFVWSCKIETLLKYLCIFIGQNKTRQNVITLFCLAIIILQYFSFLSLNSGATSGRTAQMGGLLLTTAQDTKFILTQRPASFGVSLVFAILYSYGCCYNV